MVPLTDMHPSMMYSQQPSVHAVAASDAKFLAVESTQPSTSYTQVSPERAALLSKLRASASMHPATWNAHVPSSVLAENAKCVAVESVHPFC